MQAAGEITQLKNLIEQTISHAYLNSYTAKPYISDEKLALLHRLGSLAPLDIEKQRMYILNAMLAQVALDTHDAVARQNDRADNEQADKTTQLTVLAGDYYSGLYYFLLSKEGEIAYTRELALAIKEINELKMELYHLPERRFGDIATYLRLIEARLAEKFAAYLRLECSVDMIRDYLLCAKLIREQIEPGQDQSMTVYGLWSGSRGSLSWQEYKAERDLLVASLLDSLEHSGAGKNIWQPLTDGLRQLYEKAWQRQDENGKEG